MKKTIPFRPVFLAMLAAVVLVGLIQVGVELSGGFDMALTSEGELTLFDWLFLGVAIGLTFLIYLAPPALLIRWLVERSTGVRAPLLRTALTFLSSFVLLALLFAALGTLFWSEGLFLGQGFIQVILTSAYIALGSALSAWWFISENRSRVQDDQEKLSERSDKEGKEKEGREEGREKN